MEAPKSGIFQSGGLTKSNEERGPTCPLSGELLPAGRRQPVIAAAVLAGVFDPSSGDPPFSLHSIQNGIERGRLEAYGAAGTALNLGGDFITVTRPSFELGEDEKLGAAILPRVINRQHIFSKNIS